MKNARVGMAAGKKTGLGFLWALIENPESGGESISVKKGASASELVDGKSVNRSSVAATNSAASTAAPDSWLHKQCGLLRHLVHLIAHQGSNVQTRSLISEVSTVSNTPELLIIVTGCCSNVATGTGPVFVTEVDNSFEAHEFAAIRQRIQDAYQSDIVSLARRYESMDDTVIMNLMIDSFGRVEAVVLQPGVDEHPMYNRELESIARKWSFPAILRHGACSIVVSGHQFGLGTIDEKDDEERSGSEV